MFKNFIRTAYRNLIKYKWYSLINVTGLAIGLSCCILILLYVSNELRYDRFYEKSDRIYRVVQTMSSESRVEAQASTPFTLGPALAAEYPQLIESAVRFYDHQVPKISLGIKEEGTYFKEANFFFADSTVVDIFEIELTRGNPEESLRNPQSLVMTEKMARKYFGDQNPIGRQLNFEGRMDLTVTGIMKEWPDHSHIKIDFIVSLNTLRNFFSNYEQVVSSWFWNPCWTYILLKEDQQVSELEDQLPFFIENQYEPNIPQSENVVMDLQPITDIHLYSQRDNEIEANGDILYIYLFSVVALLILVVACINFMNLATARSSRRSKEVGMRKVLGADRRYLVLQFLSESFFITLIAILFSLFIVYLTLPFFNNMLGLNLQLSLLSSARLIGGLIGLFVVVGFAAGTYPALFLSGFDPIKTIRGDLTKSRSGKRFRQVLVFAQFSFSIFLLIATMVIYYQLDYMKNKKMGFSQSNVILLPADLTRTIWYYDDFKQELMRNSQIAGVTGMANVLGSKKNLYLKFIPEGREGEGEISLPGIYVMYDFFDIYDIEMLAGRSFSREYGTDRNEALVINREMVEYMNWGSPEEAVGKSIIYNDDLYYVIGVTENFNHTSLYRDIEPLVINMPSEGDDQIAAKIKHIAVKFNGDDPQGVLDFLEEKWSEFDQYHPFEYFFHDQELDEIYKAETAMGNIAALFTILCIVVACLGLFGLASFTTETRTREIGIRKALGATALRIISLISKEFVILVVLANIIAWPVSWYLANWWLSDFPYRIDLGNNFLFIVLMSGLAALIVSVLTISYHSMKAASLNPADTIRNE
ncbi:MAG: FtsX-like permease family protein [Balneolaceae bacterium]|nr:FtsX-like permease family protein [Balneolaceae bacterium]